MLGPLHRTGADIPVGTDEMLFVHHLLSYGASWRTQDFLGFSYGFRPGRSPHHPLDALAAGIVGKRVNWVLDADFSDYFVRWADDFVVGFEHREDAERFWAELRDRLASFGLELNAEKTRLIEFGRNAARDRKARGVGKPETFRFLGFMHACGTTRKSGRFKLRRITDPQRVRAKLLAVKREMARRMHLPIPEQGRWLASVLLGRYGYYAVPDNIEALRAFREGLIRHWLRTLRRRSQKHRLSRERMGRLADRWLPLPRILHLWPEQRFAAITQGRSPVR